MAVLDGRHSPRKRFGQHFLTNGHIADRIVESAAIGSDDTVLEIGPGKGILTERLLRRARAVFAVEIDRDLSVMLRERFWRNKKFHLIEADILTLNFCELFRGISARIKVVSNIPYNISTPIIELFIQNRAIISDVVLMVQKEVARRLLAKPGSKDYGLTTLNLALCAEGRKVMDVRPGAFNPSPEVMSSVISLVFTRQYRYPLDNEPIYRIITGVAFRQRRKMLRNTLIPFFVSKGIPKPRAIKLLLSEDIDPQARPENLSVEDFVRLSNAFVKVCSVSTTPENRP